MRRYQLSGLEHVHMMRHVPRSYDMTRTHILHKGVNKHVDVVLRCSPKNWKKKKVAVSVVRGEKKTDAARIRANAKKGYVAVRKSANDRFEADRLAAAAAFETNYGRQAAGSDALIHDMKSQISSMAKKSAEYIDEQLAAKSVNPCPDPQVSSAADNSADSAKNLISPESRKILQDGGYRMPGDRLYPSNPYAADYLKNTSDEEFHILMNSLEKSLDEACKKYGVPSDDSETTAGTQIAPEAEPPVQPADESDAGHSDQSGTAGSYSSYSSYSDYTGSYNLPNNRSLSVNKKQEIKSEEKTEDKEEPELVQEFKPALTFTNGGEHYIPDVPDDELFDRELHRPGRSYVPPARYFDDQPNGADDQAGADVPLPDVVPEPPLPPQPQEIFYTLDEDGGPEPFSAFDEDEEAERPLYPPVPAEEPDAGAGSAPEGYPREDYEQQQVFFPDGEDGDGRLYSQPEDQYSFAEPTLYSDSDGEDGGSPDDEPPAVFPGSAEEDDSAEEQDGSPYRDDEDLPPPMLFPDDEDLPPPMIFPDEEEGYSPAPVSPDRNEYFEGDQGVVDRSGERLFSRTGDQIRKVIGVIKGSGDGTVHSEKADAPLPNQNVEITYSDGDRYNR